MEKIAPYKAKNKIRILTAGSLFDGHDAAINIMRRIIQRSALPESIRLMMVEKWVCKA